MKNCSATIVLRGDLGEAITLNCVERVLASVRHPQRHKHRTFVTFDHVDWRGNLVEKTRTIRWSGG